jgi:hypothetical protein
MVAAVPSILSRIEFENPDPQDRATAMVDYYKERQSRVENNGSQSSEYEQNASQIMKVL